MKNRLHILIIIGLYVKISFNRNLEP